LASSAFNLFGLPGAGSPSDAIGLRAGDVYQEIVVDNVWANVGYATTPIAAGDTISVCVDLSNGSAGVAYFLTPGLIAAQGATAWNGTPTADPVAASGGIGFKLTTPAYIVASFATAADVTLNTGATAFLRAPPAGFLGWDKAETTSAHPAGLAPTAVLGLPSATVAPPASTLPPAVDGTGVSATGSGTSLVLPGLTTTANDVIIAFVQLNGATVLSIDDTAGLSWTFRASQDTLGGYPIEEWRAPAPSALTGCIITVTVSANAGFLSAAAFGVSGANTTSIFDPNLALPAKSGSSDSLSLTTTTAATLCLSAYRTLDAVPTAGVAWTIVPGTGNATSLLVQYRAVTSSQSGLLAPMGLPNNGTNGGLGDAIRPADSGGEQTIRPAALGPVATTGIPIIRQRVHPVGRVSTVALGTAKQRQTIHPSGRISTATLGIARAAPEQMVPAAGRISTITVGAPGVRQAVHAAGIAPKATFGTARAAPEQMVSATGRASTATLGQPAVRQAVHPLGHAAISQVGTAHALLS